MNGDTETRRVTAVLGSGSGLPVPVEGVVPSPSLSEVVERSQQLLQRVRELRALNGRLAAHNLQLEQAQSTLRASNQELGGKVASLEMESLTARQAAEKAEERVRDVQLSADARVAEVQRATGETITEAINAVQADAAEKVAKVTREAGELIERWRSAYLTLQAELDAVLMEAEVQLSDEAPQGDQV